MTSAQWFHVTMENTAELCSDRDACFLSSHFTSFAEAQNTSALIILARLEPEQIGFSASTQEAIQRLKRVVEDYKFVDATIYDTSVILLNNLHPEDLPEQVRDEISLKMLQLWRSEVINRAAKEDAGLAELTLTYAELLCSNSAFDAEYEYWHLWTSLIPFLKDEAYNRNATHKQKHMLAPRASWYELTEKPKQLLKDRSLSFKQKNAQKKLNALQRKAWVASHIYRPHGFSSVLIAEMSKSTVSPESYSAWGSEDYLEKQERFAVFCSTAIQYLRNQAKPEHYANVQV